MSLENGVYASYFTRSAEPSPNEPLTAWALRSKRPVRVVYVVVSGPVTKLDVCQGFGWAEQDGARRLFRDLMWKFGNASSVSVLID